jgi:hypothetical protein
MIPLLCVLCGVVFVILALPILQTLSDLIISFGEVIKAKMNISISQSNQKVMDISNKNKKNSLDMIGFQSEPKLEYYDDEDDDEEYEDELSNKRKIGFTGGKRP